MYCTDTLFSSKQNLFVIRDVCNLFVIRDVCKVNNKKTETPIFLYVVCSLFPKAIFLTFIKPPDYCILHTNCSVDVVFSSVFCVLLIVLRAYSCDIVFSFVLTYAFIMLTA